MSKYQISKKIIKNNCLRGVYKPSNIRTFENSETKFGSIKLERQTVRKGCGI